MSAGYFALCAILLFLFPPLGIILLFLGVIFALFVK